MEDFMIDGPRPAREEEYDDLMRLLERSYERVREFFQNQYPHIWKKENVQFENRFIIKKDGRIVSHVGLTPLNLIVDDKVIKAGGIGGVGTDPDFRGLGFMSELLKYAIAKMKEHRFPISILGGDRQRYGSFGWETTGANLATILSKRNLKKLNLTKKVEARKYAQDNADLRKIMEIHESEPLRVQRNEALYKIMLGKPGQEVWLGEGDGDWAYLVIAGGDKEKFVIERGGKPEVFLALASNILEKIGAESLRVVQANRFTPLTDVLFKVCGGWSIEPLAMLKIIDLDSTLKSFGTQTEGIKFQMAGVDEDKFGPINFTSAKEIKLPEQAMVRLLFGPMPPSKNFKIEPDLAKVLDLIFPLNFYLWRMDHV
ncbi:hypothetical protein COS91_07030 [Candidatus Desantisbacteria bacterium CG07_land_8_20_14_0_80_39_15]|uniref:N-acetyltransferase domain-containing protein n=2 Tax=unclassified Candidatus Desantisiibacteriota TaxID=3106372 RepID=A0A2H9PEI4_9BACT|nr:MAG: hypothetical protein COS91_07030 [Candidatus Desantisbacteria bacterium CG07_land_8_20_14_0_80_39_15]PIZ17442.1 MAG: hypothetical protein COY51_00110 [Candidatus Desantisbacteria bacterium CG_4_10_14_0_8_um_filter_39_17]